MEYKFWMVKAARGSAPNKTHDTEDSAVAEAKRLAVVNPGGKFFVLEAMTVWATAEPVVHGMKVEPPPVPLLDR